MKSFAETLNGSLYGVLQWAQWETLCGQLRDSRQSWYFYAVGCGVPDAPLAGAELDKALTEMDALLRREHEETYLGIVYVDDLANPTLVKIYDPNHLGSSCGSCGYTIPPGWVLSLQAPQPIFSDIPLPGNRRRWWQNLFSPAPS
ncbi:MAG: hypothetical protein ABL892_13055 [Thiobacillaceae bacterium]